MKVVNAAQMRALDEGAVRRYKIPSLLLMENAARGLVDEIERATGPVQGKTLVIVAGRGNNGGDGLAAARHLRMRGADVCVHLLSSPERVSGDACTSLDIWAATGGRLVSGDDFSPDRLSANLRDADGVIDALLGTGLSKPVTGCYAATIQVINAEARRVFSVDIPSGISADTGAVLGHAVKADITLTMALPKWGHFLQAGLDHRGDLRVVDIGIPPSLIDAGDFQVEWVSASSLPVLPSRPKQSHKGSMGHLLVLAGAKGKEGAAGMTSLSALRCGAGLVTLALPESCLSSPALSTMEVMTLALPETDQASLSRFAERTILEAGRGKHALAIGPGLSQNPETQELVRNLVAGMNLPMVIDADGINALAEDLSCLKSNKGPRILTPHPGEMGRLIGQSASEVQKNRFRVAAEFAETWGVVLVLKGACTLVAAPDGRLRINPTGNPGMATAGSGDVLTGVIAAYLAQGLSPLDAATLGVYHHGAAGDLAAEALGEAGLLASDLIGKLPLALRERP